MLKVLNNYVLVETPEQKEEKTEGGIYLPGLRKDIPNFGIVAQSGIDGIPKGVKIWYRMWAGEEIEYGKKKYNAVHAKDLLAYESKDNKN